MVVAPIALIDRVLREKQKDVEISILAAEQTGKTVGIAAGPAFHLVGDYGRDVIYFLPTDKFAHRFGRDDQDREEEVVARHQRYGDIGDREEPEDENLVLRDREDRLVGAVGGPERAGFAIDHGLTPAR